MNEIVVIMAYYKGQKYFKEQIDSIQDQTKQPDKLIIVNDSLYDKEATGFLKKFNYGRLNVEIINNKKNIGYTLSFYLGVKKAYEQGFKYIFISDQDDIWMEDKIYLQCKELASGADICNHYSQKYIFKGDGFSKAMINFANSAGHNLAFKADRFKSGFDFFSDTFSIKQNILRELSLGFDNIVPLIALQYKLKWSTINKILILHRIHSDSQTNFSYGRSRSLISQIRDGILLFDYRIRSYYSLSNFLDRYLDLKITPLEIFQ